MTTTQPTDPVPDERTHRLLAGTAYALTAVVGATVLAVSSYYLHQYGVQSHMDGWLAWTLMIALDAGGIGGGLCWVIGTGPARHWGRNVALGNLAASVLGNILGHLLESKAIEAGPWMQILTGAVYPAELWAMVHLALVLRADRTRIPVPQPTPIPVSQPVPTPDPVPALGADPAPVPIPVVRSVPALTVPSRPAAPAPSDQDLLDRARRLRDTRSAKHLSCGRQVVMTELGVPERVARSLLKTLNSEPPPISVAV